MRAEPSEGDIGERREKLSLGFFFLREKKETVKEEDVKGRPFCLNIREQEKY